ncbi:alpha-amylase [Marchantia polymorpha subsp. ruderalis]|uniref:alpha-amylase n=2 Tax=Marchantia polymorpha TaxID=3197 RepID=A0AAF6B3Q9_MARPO|nr:hypothetical protein MARPO_0024s0059 [Marchantia polymorpha]BBN06643.1 hypothetical protein Mp_3g22820 [Marchantia polymorpha subsp. ruderalis]|eukprot:PTQ43542.1 hypothetical protein MARPO_0024s0059 [Marchantia polymorpha]
MEIFATMQATFTTGPPLNSTEVRKCRAPDAALHQSLLHLRKSPKVCSVRHDDIFNSSGLSTPVKPFFGGKRKLYKWQRPSSELQKRENLPRLLVTASTAGIGSDNSSESSFGSNFPDPVSLRAALKASQARVLEIENEKRDILEALRQSEAKVQEYAALMVQTTDEALSELEASKKLFKAELSKVLEEKSTLQKETLLAKQDAVNLAVKIEKIAESAIQEATQRFAEDLVLKDSAAETAAAEAAAGVEESIRLAASDAAALVVTEASTVMEEALAAASLAKQQATKAQEALAKGMEIFEELSAAKLTTLSLQEKVSYLERELGISQGIVESLRLELKASQMRTEAANARAAEAEAAVQEVQRAAAEDGRERDDRAKQTLEEIKATLISKTEVASVVLQADLEALKAAYHAAQEAGNVKEQANLRMYEALERSLAAAEGSAEAWKNRALSVEGLLRRVKEEGLEAVSSVVAEEMVAGGRMETLLGNDSRKRDLLANGPRRETPEWMRRRIEVGFQGLPPRSSMPTNSEIEAQVPLHLPRPDEVWSIFNAKVKEDDLYTKQAVEKEALDEQRRALERALQKKTVKRHPEDGEGKLESGTGSGREIVFQGFNWESWRRKWYLELAPKAADLKKCGITTIWMPPPTESVAPQGYMPGDLYNLNSAYGTVDELKQCIEEMHNNDILVLGDAVLNHRCAQKQSPNGVWNIFGGKLAWGPEAIVKDDPNFQGRGNPSSGDFFHAAPNIDHSQDFIRRDIKEWMKWLRSEIGFDGWRLDYVRGFWGGYVKEYIEATDPAFSIGEYWDSLAYDGGQVSYNQDAHRQRIINWINATGGTSSAFDVTTKGILHSALHNEYWRLIDPQGKPPGVMGWWPSRAVTFLENHDTGSTQGHWPFPRDKLMQGYAYILTHPGTPVIFYDHFYDFGLHDQIAELIAARKRTAVHCRSPVKIFHANIEGYVAQVGENLVMKLGRLDWNPSKENNLAGSWERFLDRGSEYQLWERK